MDHSPEDRITALTVALTALVRALVKEGDLDSAAMDQALVTARARMVRLEFDAEALAAYDDLSRTLASALE